MNSAQFIREWLLTTLFWGPLACLYLPRHSWWLPIAIFLPPLLAAGVRARGWVRLSRRTALALTALAVLAAVFYVFCARGTESLAGGLYNSDTLEFPALWQSLRHGEPLSGWVFPASPQLFPDIAAYFLLSVLIPNFRLALILFGALQVLALLGCFSLVEAAALPESRNKPLRFFVFVALMAYLAHDGAFLGLQKLFEAAMHMGAMISLLFCLWLIFRIIRRECGRRALLACGLALFLVTLLTTLSDALFLVQFVAPAVATLTMMWLLGAIGGRKFALLTAIMAAGALGGRWIYGRFFMRPELGLYFALSPSHVSGSWEQVLRIVRESGGIPVLLGLFILISIAACVGLILVHIRLPRRRRADADGPLFCLASFLIFLGLSNLSAILFSSTVADWQSLARYTIPLVLLPLLFLSTAAQYAFQRLAVDVSQPVRLALLLALPLLLILTVQKSPNVVRLAGYYPQWVSDLDREFAERNLKFGLAQYWQAKYFSLFSRRGVQVVQMKPPLLPYLWVNHRDWYRRPFEFIITDETTAQRTPEYKASFYLDPAPIVSRFGPPDETFTCGSNTVRVYKAGRLRDCFPQFADFSKVGAQADFDAVQLPSQVGALAGESRIAEGCAAGYVTYGPYAQLCPGAYRGRISYEATPAVPGAAVGEWDVLLHVPGRKYLLIVQKGLLSPQSSSIEFGFAAGADSVAEVRTFYSGAGKLVVRKLTLERTQ